VISQEELDALWDFNDPEASEARFRTAATSSSESAVLLTQAARALGLQGRMDEAHALLDSLPDDRVRVPLERGRLYNSAGETELAIPLFTEAADNASGFLKVDALHMLAIADSANAAQWTAQALRIVEISDDARIKRWATSLLNNYGWALHDAGDLAGALSRFTAALEAAVTAEQKHIAQWTIAHTLRLLGDGAQAREILESLDQSDPYVRDELDALRAD
jgi:tetratricopeptide (TPR) repeat protein